MCQSRRPHVIALVAGLMFVFSGVYLRRILVRGCRIHLSNNGAAQLRPQNEGPLATLSGGSQGVTLSRHYKSERQDAGYPGALSSLNSREVYSRIMVVPRMSTESMSWLDEELPGLRTIHYTADDVLAPHHPPMNKGHEVVVYLSFILEHYETLPDVVIFMHAHRYSHHNSELLDFDAVQMLKRLSSEHVVRHGYVNMRCDWSPGCPEWLHSGAGREVLEKQEEVVLSEVWRELFPERSLPRTLAQPCCAQFAVSRKAIRSMPKSRFVFFRDWILRTPLNDYVSGRIWEYCWQSLFVGQSVFCPNEQVCHCDGFGVCFDGHEKFQAYKQLQRESRRYRHELDLSQPESIRTQGSGGQVLGETDIRSDLRRSLSVHQRILAIEKESVAQKTEALERGYSLQFNSSKGQAG